MSAFLNNNLLSLKILFASSLRQVSDLWWFVLWVYHGVGKLLKYLYIGRRRCTYTCENTSRQNIKFSWLTSWLLCTRVFQTCSCLTKTRWNFPCLSRVLKIPVVFCRVSQQHVCIHVFYSVSEQQVRSNTQCTNGMVVKTCATYHENQISRIKKRAVSCAEIDNLL